MKLPILSFLFFSITCYCIAGDVTDLGTSDGVPDWAIGPLFLSSIDSSSPLTKENSVRVGTVQRNSFTLFGKRYPLKKINLSEIANDSKICELETESDSIGFYRIHLYQPLGDQTSYFISIAWVDKITGKETNQPQFRVWDIKSN